jgi:hypothetical protein
MQRPGRQHAAYSSEGGVNVDYVLPLCIGAGLLWGRGSGLGLLGGGSLGHVRGLVLVVVVIVDLVIIIKVIIIVVIVVGHVVDACIL